MENPKNPLIPKVVNGTIYAELAIILMALASDVRHCEQNYRKKCGSP
jgi:hypothetical protein